MSVPEVGQSTARRLYRAATAGGADSFTLAEDVALRLAHACDTLVAELEAARLGGHRIAETDGTAGFPDLPTGHALAAGFRGKAVQYLETLTALQETALCFKAAYLAAGGKLAEADLANRAALAVVAARSGSDHDRHEQDGHG
ncbi:hypothetical protein [Nocardia jinanensis]|uniref:Uncharacterized protein n=1 Tax=Nocardia jinanensis TaxID=382504 RepID=A0A917RTL8_9NOCA|nr:hypothetical protein [Nocardia jinanensis]GGL28896.1 hypothetical protein GCM10011588_49710 [Nocardia jinanensis]